MRDDICCWIADRLPRRLVYWCAVRLMANASRQRSAREVNALTPAGCLKAWAK